MPDLSLYPETINLTGAFISSLAVSSVDSRSGGIGACTRRIPTRLRSHPSRIPKDVIGWPVQQNPRRFPLNLSPGGCSPKPLPRAATRGDTNAVGLKKRISAPCLRVRTDAGNKVACVCGGIGMFRTRNLGLVMSYSRIPSSVFAPVSYLRFSNVRQTRLGIYAILPSRSVGPGLLSYFRSRQ